MNNKKIKLAIVDDHVLFAHGLKNLLIQQSDYEVLYVCSSGEDLQSKLKSHSEQPDLILVDLNMPNMNGIELTKWLKQNYPTFTILAISMMADEANIIKIIKAGAAGYLLKDSHPNTLIEAISSAITNGFFSNDIATKALVNAIKEDELKLTEKESHFLKLACSEMTYKEIADKMCLSPKTIDGYRESLFQKLEVKNRIGLVLYGIKHKLVEF